MESVVQIASYIYERYQREFGQRIDEMKLHKLLYFTQRECIVQTGQPLFPEEFLAWKYGPVIIEIRDVYKNDTLNEVPAHDTIALYADVLDVVFKKYARKDSWSLARLSHGELSWENGRKGLSPTENGLQKMNLADIRKDAERIKQRRSILSHFKIIT